MEVRSGYKQTEVGVIPEDWRVKLLPEVCKFRGGKAHEQHISASGRYVCVNSKFISSNGVVRKYSTANFCPAKKGDVLMVMSDLPNGRALAKAYLVEADSTYAVNQRVCALTAYRDAPEYLFYALNRSPYFLKFDDGVNQTHLLNPVFQKCPLALPPTVEEQRGIATALSDVDALLGGLDRLIAKKCDLKQAAMQQLLAGRTRLPGFHGEWDVKSLHEVCRKIQDGTHFSPKSVGNDYLYITSKNIRAGKLDLSTAGSISAIEHAKIYARCDVKKGDLLLTKDGANTGNAALNPLDEPFSLLSSVAMLRFDPRQNVAAYFMYQILSANGQTQIAEAMSGNAITRLTLKKIRALRFPVASLPEQTAISAALSDMDAALASLEARRDKTRDLKQAMMQELLTGKTRLVPAGGADA